MISELIEHLQKSPEAGTPISVWRDDDAYPFSNLSLTPMLIKEQGNSSDRHIGSTNYDIWLFSQGNGTSEQLGTINTRIKALQDWLVNSTDYTGRMYGVSIINGVSGAYKDGQNRWSYTISIQVRRGHG